MKEYDFNSTPIVDIVNSIIIDAVNKNASDIHFDPAENYLKIRLRVDGELSDYSIVENKYKRNLITRVKLISGMNITETRLPQDGAIKGVIGGKDLDMRVSALPTSFGEKVVIRILDYTMSMKGLETLGFTGSNYDLILKMLESPNGIILITGATGSGKSTTVYSMLQKLNKEETNIITVEDPVEMNIEGINQVQVNSEIGLDFAQVLRSILRQDPNIILIGEIRDSETAKIAVRSSITGHLVLSTLHTNNSLTTIERLLDMDVERYLLSSSLKGIISQTLAKRLCTKCAKKRPTTPLEKRIFEKALHKNIEEVMEPVGCDACHKGFKGRIALQEVLLIDDKIRDAINENIPRSELRNLIYSKRHVKTLLQDGLQKAADGITTIQEVLKLVDIDENSDELYGKDNSDLEQSNNIEQNNTIENQEIEKNEFEKELENEKKYVFDKNDNNNLNINSIINERPIFESNTIDEIKPSIPNTINEITPNEIKPSIPNTINEITPNEIKPSIPNTINEITPNEIKPSISNTINEIAPNEIKPSIELNNYIKPNEEKIINLDNTQDIFKLFDKYNDKDETNKEKPQEKQEDIIIPNDIPNKKEKENNSNYTDDLIKLINEGFFE